MEFMPRFGHHVIPASQINIGEAEPSNRFVTNVEKATRLHTMWYPIIVEVIEEGKEYILIDGLKRFNFWVNRLQWRVVECIVMPASSREERQLRRLGINTLSQSYIPPYDMHCTLYGMKKSGISDDEIVQRSGLSQQTIRKYLWNVHLPLDLVLTGQSWRVGYDGWVEILSIPVDHVDKESQMLIRDIYLHGQCHAYQLSEIISASATRSFQELSYEDKVHVLREMCLQTKNPRASMKPTTAELFGFAEPEAGKVVLYTQNVLSNVERLLQPEVLRKMLPSQRQVLQQSISSVLYKFEPFDTAQKEGQQQPENQLFQ